MSLSFCIRQQRRVARYRLGRNRRRRFLSEKGGIDGYGHAKRGKQSFGASGLAGGILALTPSMEASQQARLNKLKGRYVWDDRNKKTVRRT